MNLKAFSLGLFVFKWMTVVHHFHAVVITCCVFLKGLLKASKHKALMLSYLKFNLFIIFFLNLRELFDYAVSTC